jgi:putative ABC transport system permease protein
VVKDVKEDRFNFRINRAVWYLPYAQYGQYLPTSFAGQINLVVQAHGDPATLAGAIRHVIRSIDPHQPISNLATMTEHLAGVLVTERFSAVLMGLLAGLGLTLAALGLYGVMAYTVSQRTGEIGLRMALGARPVDIFNMVLGQGVVLIAIGLGAGVVGALVLMRLLASTLHEVSATDPATFIVISLLLMGVALLASYIPARRAAKLDPMVALRYE